MKKKSPSNYSVVQNIKVIETADYEHQYRLSHRSPRQNHQRGRSYGIRRRVKRITLKLEENSLTVSIKHRIKKLKTGDTVIVYLSEKTQVYPQDSGFAVFDYLALEVRNGV